MQYNHPISEKLAQATKNIDLQNYIWKQDRKYATIDQIWLIAQFELSKTLKQIIHDAQK